MQLSENQFRDFLFDHYTENFSDLIVNRREPVSWNEDTFPPIHFLLQQRAENKINSILDDIENLILVAKELPLERDNDSTTRVDLLGNSESTGLTIIELKKSKQTERQAFTELLAYANHFCSIFPGLEESSITSVLVSPMKTRIARDSYSQELVLNNKNIVALIPEETNGTITLSAYYPDSSYYQWFENNLLDDRSMLTVAISFPYVDGWIDSDLKNENRQIPEYSKKALNTISSTISHKLESASINSIVYASQKWGEIGQNFPYPNTILVAALNPFASFRTSVDNDSVYGDSLQGRISEIQSIHSKLNENEREF